jgi:phosphate/sulfate permease
MNPIIKYFHGEKAESYIFMMIGVIAFAMALYFFFALKTSFWKGVAVPFIIVALLEFVVGYTIVTRSPKDIARVETYLQQAPKNIKTIEIPRMEKVMSNFVVYRYVEIALIILGIILMYSSMQDTFWRGLGLGLFMQASIVLCLDFFAERRGHIYVLYLQELIEKI